MRALLLQVFYSVRSERLLMEQLNYNLLFRWFVGLEIDDAGCWSHTVFSKNRDRLLNQELAQKFFAHVKEQAVGLMSDEHFTVDGTLIEAWAGQKSFRRKDKGGSGSVGRFSRRVAPQPDARLAHRPGIADKKKSAGQESKLSYLGHTLVENRNGLIAALDHHAGRWQGGARCRFINVARVDPEAKRSDHDGSGQSLWHARLRRHGARVGRDAAQSTPAARRD